MRALAITSTLLLSGCAATNFDPPNKTLVDLNPVKADSGDRRFVGKWVADFEGAVFEEDGTGRLFRIEAPVGYEEFLFPEKRRFREPTEDFAYECLFVSIVAIPINETGIRGDGVPTLLFRKLESFSIPAPEDRVYYTCLKGLG